VGAAAATRAHEGLTSQEAEARLRRFGPNTIPEETPPVWRALLPKFWTPVPWMLEGTIALELLLRKPLEAVVFALLLGFNGILGFTQEHRAQRALRFLRERLTVEARVRRDGRWSRLSAKVLVPGDVVHLRAGDLVPADTRLCDGRLSVDQSALTGESLPIEAEPGATAFAGSMVKDGEATGEVTATGTGTAYGKTAELVRAAAAPGHLAILVSGIVRYLLVFDLLLVAVLIAYATAARLPVADVLPFGAVILIAAIPVALPATFTLATAFGAIELAGRGVLVARLSAIEEAAEMDVLCADKTGTLTQNRSAIAELAPAPPYTEADLLGWAALACDEATQDPIDQAILAAARAHQVPLPFTGRVRFVPFDPGTKRSGVIFHDGDVVRQVVKGAVQAVVPAGAADRAWAAEHRDALAAGGARVLAVAAGRPDALALVGLVALHDPPRDDSKALVRSLRDLGIRVVMVTGDGLATAASIATRVGIGTRAAPAGALEGADVDVTRYDIFARVLPAGKFNLVRALQRGGHRVGMTGDGINDAPALRQAEVGIAVATATDVAKAAAGLVLTRAGLVNIVAAVEASRRIHQRMLTYTLNKIVKTFELSLLLTLGLIVGGIFITKPLLIVLLLFANDFATMAVATDRARAAPTPDRWDLRALVLAALVVAGVLLAFSSGVVWAGWRVWHLPLSMLQTLVFLWLVIGMQATVYLVRERGAWWRSRPGRWLVASTVGDLAAVSVLATRGWLMAPVGPGIIGALLVVAAGYMTVADLVKVPVFRACGLR
jgi:H+-transporting ATPase